jgi:diguanylate cyclase (GGDEF)-like protein
MGTTLGVADTMTVLSSKLTTLIPWTTVALFLDDPEHDAVRCRFATGRAAAHLLDRIVECGTGLSGWVAQNRATLIHADLPPDAEGEPYDDALKSAIVCPLLCNDRFVGTLALYHRDPNRYGDDDRRLLERVAEQAGPVIHNAVIFEQAREDSLTDPLTGLANRRAMVSHLSRELARAARLQSEVALVMVDMDEFKAINDTYGHHVGDQALRAVADAIHSPLRPYDLCARYAGDEFVIVLSDSTREAADARRRELQQRISDIVFEVQPGTPLRLDASAGAAVYPHDGDTLEALLADADRRMYRDKAVRQRKLSSTTLTPREAPLGDARP